MNEENNFELSMEINSKEKKEEKLEYYEYEKEEQLFSEENNELNQLLSEKEEKFNQLMVIQDNARTSLATREGYKNYEVIKVDHYDVPVKLVSLETGDLEEMELSVATAQDLETMEIIEIYYLDGKEADIAELMRKYESPTPIKELIDTQDPDLELNNENDEIEIIEFEDKSHIKDENEEESIEVVEFEDKPYSEKGKRETKEKQEKENSVIGKKPSNVIQRLDPHTTYYNGLQTISNKFNISSDVHELVVAYKEQGDDEALSNSITLYMLDKDGKIIEESNNKKISELFELDNSTGINSMSDNSTRIKLDGSIKQDENRTMARFRSKEDKDANVSIDEKETLGHHKVYTGGKAMNGNNDVEVQVDTKDNSNIQTNLNAQRVVDYGDGKHKPNEVDEVVREDLENGVEEEKISLENTEENEKNIESEKILENENTVDIVNNPYIPGTEITWEELSKKTGEGITKLQERFERELEAGKEPKDIVDEIEYDYGMVEHTRERM